MSLTLKLVLLPALLGLVHSEFPVDVEESFTKSETNSLSYRLPEDLDPIHYDVEITPYFKNEGDNEAFTFKGIVHVTVRATKKNISSLIIQENVRKIESVTLRESVSHRVVPLNIDIPFERIREYHFLKINLRDEETLNNNDTYIITIEYIGNINETPLSRGMFRGSYKDDNGNVHWYAATHLQPVNSRQAFPSFDEPGFKSTFKIIIYRPADYIETYSNMRLAENITIGDRVKETFHTTPRMSAYLISFHISDGFIPIADNNDTEKSYRILARPNAVGQGEYALEVGPPLTDWFGNYFGIDYYEMVEDMKNDQIAVPDWASGATENWGLVSYRELRLLYEEGETNALDKMSIGTITAHELAHKWFGNLITCRWWDNVWINEGFASYFEYFAMHGVYPKMELEDQFNIMYLQSALSVDSSISTRALQHTVNSPAEVTGHFSGISYTKGASLLLMLKHFVTEDTFKKALNKFLVDRRFEHAFPEDIYRAFAEAVEEDKTISVNISTFIKYWVDEPGYPLLNVKVNMANGEISLTQERFFISASANKTQQTWPLPLTFTTADKPNFNDLRPKKVMTTDTDSIRIENLGHNWVIFNLQQKGIYRVNYDDHNWEMIAETLNNEPNKIHHLNRAQIVDDVFALMRSEKMSYEFGFKILKFLKKETSYFVWYPAITGFNWLRNRLLHLPDVLAEFDKLLFEYLDAVISDLGYDVRSDEPLTTTLNRFFVMSFACNIGHQQCVSDSLNKYKAFKNNETRLDPNLRRHVFCIGLQDGDYDDWKFLYNRRLNSNNQADQVVMLRALGCSRNESAVNEHLKMILSDDVKAQDSLNAFTFLFMGGSNNAKLALQFIKNNLDAIRKKVVLQTWFQNVISNLASYSDEEGLKKMEEWLRSVQATFPEYSVGMSAITSARNNMQWGTNWAQRIVSGLRGSAVIVMPTMLLILTTLIALTVK